MYNNASTNAGRHNKKVFKGAGRHSKKQVVIAGVIQQATANHLACK